MNVTHPLDRLHKRRTEEGVGNSGCGPGWNKLLLALDAKLAAIDSKYTIGQYKEKFGTLRFYVNASYGLSDDAYKKFLSTISEAESESARVCETCGKPGRLRGDRWWYTACDACDAKRHKSKQS